MDEFIEDYREFELVQRCDVLRAAAKGKRVLHLGCTNAPYTQQSIDANMLLHFDLAASASELWGIDTDENGIAILRSHGIDNLVVGDLESVKKSDFPCDFDIIIAGEMIEHLNNPGQFLSSIADLMTERTLLIITTINAYCAVRFLWYGIRGKGGRNEVVHPDHVAYYSYSTLKLIIERHQMCVERFMFYDIGVEHRPFSRRIFNMVNDVAVRLAPQWADGVIAVCRKQPASPLSSGSERS